MAGPSGPSGSTGSTGSSGPPGLPGARGSGRTGCGIPGDGGCGDGGSGSGSCGMVSDILSTAQGVMRAAFASHTWSLTVRVSPSMRRLTRSIHARSTHARWPLLRTLAPYTVIIGTKGHRLCSRLLPTSYFYSSRCIRTRNRSWRAGQLALPERYARPDRPDEAARREPYADRMPVPCLTEKQAAPSPDDPGACPWRPRGRTLDNGAHGLPGRATVYEAIHAQPARMIEWLAALTPFDRLLKSGLFGA